MAKKHLRLDPHRVTNDFWWYEENKGICVCVEFNLPDGQRKTAVRDIPWRAIRAALIRKDR